MPTITTRASLTRTRAALAAYDAIEAEVTDDMTQDEADDFFKRSDAAKLVIGEAFALDTQRTSPARCVRRWGNG